MLFKIVESISKIFTKSISLESDTDSVEITVPEERTLLIDSNIVSGNLLKFNDLDIANNIYVGNDAFISGTLTAGNLGINVNATQAALAKFISRSSADNMIALTENAGLSSIIAWDDVGSSNTLRLAGNPLVMTGDGGGGAEHVRVTSAGNVGIGTSAPNFTLAVTGTLGVSGNTTIANGNLIFGTAGKGVDFSINSNVAGMTSELLDDYERGTWTPVISGTTTQGSFGFGSNEGHYNKIGQTVFYSVYLDPTSVATAPTGTLYITGLPFVQNISPSSNNNQSTFGYSQGLAVAITSSLTGIVLSGESRISLRKNWGANALLGTDLVSGGLNIVWIGNGWYNTTS